MSIVYSTNPDFNYDDESIPEVETLPANQQKLRLRMERSGRGGKTVTVVSNFIGKTADLEVLAKQLKNHCAVGGSVKDGEIILQGDFREKVATFLRSKGYPMK